MRRTLVLLCTAQFVDVLDGTAVLVALPALGRDLGLHGAGLQWVVTAYVLVFGGCLLAAGRLADALGRRRVFAAGMALFTAASAACGAAPSAAVLVPARALQGLGAALTAPAALAMIIDAFPAGRPRQRAVATWTGVAAAGGAAGLMLGGAITAALGWRWVFLVNVPVGLATLAAAPRVLAGVGDPPRARGDRRRAAGGGGRDLDLPGAAAATCGLGLLVLAATQAQQAGPLAPGTLAALAGAALALAGFARRERAAPRPLVPPALLRERPLALALAVSAALTATTSGGAVLATLQLQDGLGLGPAAAAAALLPFSLAVVAGSLVRLAARTAVAGGLGLVAAASVTAACGPGTVAIGAWGALAGLGLGAASVATTTLGVSAVGEADRGAASALLNTAAQVGTALGVAALVLAGHRLGFAAAAALAALAAALTGRALRQERAATTRREEVPSTATKPA